MPGVPRPANKQPLKCTTPSSWLSKDRDDFYVDFNVSVTALTDDAFNQQGLHLCKCIATCIELYCCKRLQADKLLCKQISHPNCTICP